MKNFEESFVGKQYGFLPGKYVVIMCFVIEPINSKLEIVRLFEDVCQG